MPSPTSSTLVLTRLSSISSAIGIGSLRRTPNYMCLLFPPLPEVFYVNFPFLGSSYHVLQCLTGCKTNKLLDIIPQHVMVPIIVHLLVYDILWDQHISLLKLGGDLHHGLSRLAQILKFPYQLLYLNTWCSQSISNLLPSISGSLL